MKRLLFLIIPFLLAAYPVQAANPCDDVDPALRDKSGCCLVLEEQNYHVHFDRTDNCEACKALNINRPDKWEFKPGLVPSPNRSKCVTPDQQSAPPLEVEPNLTPSTITPPILGVTIPGFTKFSEVNCQKEDDCKIPWISEYILALYNYGLIAIGLLSVIMLMIGGIMRVASAGGREMVSQANAYIRGSIIGLTLAFCSYLVLYIVNPKLTLYPSLGLKYIEQEDLESIDLVVDEAFTNVSSQKYPNVKKYNPKNGKPSDAAGCDNCVVTTIPTTNAKSLNRDLNAKLVELKTRFNFVISEAYPPSQAHDDTGHYNGHCVDIALRPKPTGEKKCTFVDPFITAIKGLGVRYLNEYIGCLGAKKTAKRSGDHVHVCL